MELKRILPSSDSANKYKYASPNDTFRLFTEDNEAADIYMRIDAPNKTQKLSVNLHTGVAVTFKPDTKIMYVGVNATWTDNE